MMRKREKQNRRRRRRIQTITEYAKEVKKRIIPKQRRE